jgi:hypothetical protein
MVAVVAEKRAREREKNYLILIENYARKKFQLILICSINATNRR